MRAGTRVCRLLSSEVKFVAHGHYFRGAPAWNSEFRDLSPFIVDRSFSALLHRNLCLIAQ